MYTRQTSYLRWLLWAAVLLWAGLIFYMSAQASGSSSAMSRGFIRSAASLFPPFREMSEPEQLGLISALNTLVRKAAHWSLYFVLGSFSALLSLCYPLSCRTRTLLVPGSCLLYALSDEWHQYFVPGRSCELRDVLIDFCGASTGALLTFLVLFLLSRKKRSASRTTG